MPEVEETQDNELIVAKVAERIRKAYCFRRNRISLRNYNPPPKYKHIWTKAAKQCIAYKINPSEFIEVQFFALKPYPELSQLTKHTAVKRFFDYRDQHAASTANDVLIEMAALEKMLAIGRKPRDLLTDPNQDMDPLFKYVISKYFGLDDLASLFWDDALELYTTSIYYDEVYKDLITDELKKAAEEVRDYAND